MNMHFTEDRDLNSIMVRFLIGSVWICLFDAFVGVYWAVLYFKGCPEIGWQGMDHQYVSLQQVATCIFGGLASIYAIRTTTRKWVKCHPIFVCGTNFVIEAASVLAIFYSVLLTIAISCTVQVVFRQVYELQFKMRFNRIFCQNGQDEVKTSFDTSGNACKYFATLCGAGLAFFIPLGVYWLVGVTIFYILVLSIWNPFLMRMADRYMKERGMEKEENN